MKTLLSLQWCLAKQHVCACTLVHVCVCVCACVHTHVHVHMCVCLFMCVYMCMSMCEHVCVHMHMCVHTCTCVYICVYEYVWACVRAHACMCICGCIHMHMCVCTHMCVYMYMSVCMCVWVCVSMSVCMCIHMFMCLFNAYTSIVLFFPSPFQFYPLFIWHQKSKLCVWLLREVLGQWMVFSHCLWGCHHVAIESTLCLLICWCFCHVETVGGEVISLTFLRKDLVLQLLKQDTFPNSQLLPNNSKYL